MFIKLLFLRIDLPSFLLISVAKESFTNNTIFSGYNFIDLTVVISVTKGSILSQEQYKIIMIYVMIYTKPFCMTPQF